MTPPPTSAYLRDAVMTATPEQLQLMLYDGAIRFATQARDAIQARDFEASYNKLSRAQAIILEMQNGLRPEVNPELCDRMSALYSFLYRKLVDASVRRDVQDIDDALKILRHQRETWVMLIDKVNKTRGQAAEPDPSRDAERRTAMDSAVGSSLSVQG
jgi:flagellar protein FliS